MYYLILASIIFLLTSCSNSIINNEIPFNPPSTSSLEQNTNDEDESEIVYEKERKNEFKPSILLNWYDENKDNIFIKNDVMINQVISKISRRYDSYMYGEIPFDLPIDRASFYILNQSGYDTVTHETLLSSPIIPEEFIYKELGIFKYIKNSYLGSEHDLNFIKEKFLLEDNEYNYFLNSDLEISQDCFIIINYIQFLDYEFEVTKYKYITTIDKPNYDFNLLNGDAWIKKAKSGISLGSRDIIKIVDYGSFSKEQIMLAYKILNSNEEEINYSGLARIWAYWVLNDFYDLYNSDLFNEYFYVNTPLYKNEYSEIFTVKKAIVAQGSYYSQSFINGYIGVKKNHYSIDDLINGLIKGDDIEYSVNNSGFIYSKY